MNVQEAQILQLHEMVVWTPDGMRGEVIVKDGSGVKIRWEDGQFGYYGGPGAVPLGKVEFLWLSSSWTALVDEEIHALCEALIATEGRLGP
jgi:hypothetical protein